MSICGRDRVLTASDAFLCIVFLFKIARKTFNSVHNSHSLCLQKTNMASRDPGDDETSGPSDGHTTTGLTATAASVVYRPR